MRRVAQILVSAGLAALASACQTVNPSVVGGLARSSPSEPKTSELSYFGGRAVQTFAQPPASVQPAVVAALDDLRVHKVRQTNEGGTIVFEGTTADKRQASITLRPQAGGSRLSARFGLFGDEALSRALMDRVAVRVGALPAEPTPSAGNAPSEPGKVPYFSRTGVPDSMMFRDQAEAPYRNTAVPN
jgi:hypothetical protein